MIKIILFACISLLACSCGTQKQTAGVKGAGHFHRQWLKQRSDGYWEVTTMHNMKKSTETVFECKPDSVTLSRL